MFGSWTHLRDQYNLLKLSKDIQSIRLTKHLSNYVPIYELKFQKKDDMYTHKGATVRISSFIMEMARTHLMRMKHIIAKELGYESISYCDTDSIVISFDKCDQLTDIFVDQCFLNCRQILMKEV